MREIPTWTGRDTLVSQFLAFRSTFPIDFTPEFLGQLPVEKLRHMIYAYPTIHRIARVVARRGRTSTGTW